MTHKCKVLVVGGGVMGASVAWHLTQAGAAVTLIDQGSGSVPSATAASFGWVGASASTPSDDTDAFALRLHALEEYTRLKQSLGALPVTVRGALSWGETKDETAALIAEHLAAGSRVESLSAAQVRQKEPSLAAVPDLAMWAPDDFALEPVDLARCFIQAAQANGATVLSGTVQRVLSAGGRVNGIEVQGQVIEANKVVLANAYGALALAASAGVALPIEQQPAVLLRLDADRNRVRHLLCAQDLELRPGKERGLMSALDYPLEGEAGLQRLAEQTCQSIAQLLQLPSVPRILSIEVGQRPMTSNKQPLCGPIGTVDGLFAVVAHPGVILAPLLGSLCTQAVLAA
ncbi:FAD-binding oxidoreductase [Alcaligenes nematophilus]|uniref:NAD(P)/FAD-dependent oxidoreductase n=1 Tax=Alcaligenes nematophilus TaxID=2994643 RepID=UPI00384EE75D